MRVAIVGDDPLMVQTLRLYLSSSPQIEVLSVFISAYDLLTFLKRIPVDILVSGVYMSDMGGLELLTRVREKHPRTTVVMLTSFDDGSAVPTALSQQASGFLLKNSLPGDMIRAVITTHSGGTIISLIMTSRPVSQYLRPCRAGGHPGLTEVEQAVLDLLCGGYSNAEIAGRLTAAGPTVKTHVSDFMKRYGTPLRLKFMAAVHQSGWQQLIAPHVLAQLALFSSKSAEPSCERSEWSVLKP